MRLHKAPKESNLYQLLSNLPNKSNLPWTSLKICKFILLYTIIKGYRVSHSFLMDHFYLNSVNLYLRNIPAK